MQKHRHKLTMNEKYIQQ